MAHHDYNQSANRVIRGLDLNDRARRIIADIVNKTPPYASEQDAAVIAKKAVQYLHAAGIRFEEANKNGAIF